MARMPWEIDRQSGANGPTRNPSSLPRVVSSRSNVPTGPLTGMGADAAERYIQSEINNGTTALINNPGEQSNYWRGSQDNASMTRNDDVFARVQGLLNQRAGSQPYGPTFYGGGGGGGGYGGGGGFSEDEIRKAIQAMFDMAMHQVKMYSTWDETNPLFNIAKDYGVNTQKAVDNYKPIDLMGIIAKSADVPRRSREDYF